MTSQDILNLQLLERATDPTTPVDEAAAIQEMLAYAISLEREVPEWIFAILHHTDEQELPESLLLWLIDVLEANGIARISERNLSAMATWWPDFRGAAAKSRVFEWLLTEQEQSERRPTLQELLGKIIALEFQTESREGAFALLDLILSSRDTELFKEIAVLAGTERHLQQQFHSHLLVRLPYLEGEMRSRVEEEMSSTSG